MEKSRKKELLLMNMKKRPTQSCNALNQFTRHQLNFCGKFDILLFAFSVWRMEFQTKR